MRLAGTEPATRLVPTEVGRGVVGRYRFRIIEYYQPAGAPFVGFPAASRRATVNVGA